MQHAHILAPPTRSAGWYLRVRQLETVYHLRTPHSASSGDQKSTTAATAAACQIIDS
ncbi:unnamed protein product [Acanthoscelides obtectus]|uniref:Uncharacterized protein n=1 Tax=Acanthoscelides obtectus TaxID=200917 RepID=A0A9P0L1R6_ACAOB|nr:unnamed protein product [Acanthoscelides obtectus]CAK1630564.1 hypothetical protein AOBTE_LOCUS6413 [Acanthoscelides obtectus]